MQIGKNTLIPPKTIFEINIDGKKNYVVVGNLHDNLEIDYCYIERIPQAFVWKTYSDDEESLDVTENPFYFSRNHINWFRNYLIKKQARTISDLEKMEFENFLELANQDGFRREVEKLKGICS